MTIRAVNAGQKRIPADVASGLAEPTGEDELTEREIGILKLWSEPGAGTEAELIVPARIAYQTDHRRERLGLFRRTKAES